MAKQNNTPYLKEKVHLYFDENFPEEVINALSSERALQRRCKICTVKSEGNEGKEDRYHVQFCKKNELTLVTLDKDFMDDRKYPISNIPGIIRVVARKNDNVTILSNLFSFLEFVGAFPFPRSFIFDTKFEVRTGGCLIRGKHVKTRKIISFTIKSGDDAVGVAKAFGYI